MSTITIAIRRPITPDDLAGLYARVCAQLAVTSATVAVCDVGDVDVSARTIHAITRLRLATKQHQCELRLQGASADLSDLVHFCGLKNVLLPGADRVDRIRRA
jgi:hypothetical protein